MARVRIHSRRPGGKSKARKGKGRRKSRIPRSIMPRGQTCNVRETIEFTDLLPNTAYAASFTLGQFARASTIAANFKWYKAKYVEFSYEPLYNFYREDPTVPQPTMPYIYFSMNRTQSARSQNLFDFQAEGSRPTKFNNKIVRRYKPNWCSQGLMTGAPLQGNVLQAGLYANGLQAEYGWLMAPEAITTNNTGQITSPLEAENAALNGMTQTVMVPINTNQVLYNGHTAFIEQTSSVTGAVLAKVTCTVHWAFKDASSYGGISAPTPMRQKDTDPLTTRGDQPPIPEL